MTTQEEFDAWWNKESGWRKAFDTDDWFDIAFEAWQASRAAALEEAAKECEKAYSYDSEALLIAEAVRALKD